MNDVAWSAMLALAKGDDAAAPEQSAVARSLAPLVEAKRGGTPLVVAQLGQSLDGRIATPTGDSKGINNLVAMTHLHRLRALVDAVVVGAGTARADNPRLTVRHCIGESPVRVVIDPNGTVRPDAEVWRGDDGVGRIVFGGNRNLSSDVDRIALPAGELRPDWIIDALGERGLSRLLIEGGGKTVSHFLERQAIDYLHLLFAPVIIGSGPVGLNLPAIGSLEQATRPVSDVHLFESGDVLYACRLK